MGPLFRGLKQLIAAILLIVAALCVSEVGLRVHRFYQQSYTPDARPPSVDDALVLPSPDTFQQLRPLAETVLRQDDGDRDVLIRTNSFGLRGAEIMVPKPAGVFRVICLGDESTLDFDLPEQETYCARLQQRLQQRTRLEVEVVNAGLPGGCPLTALLLLRHRLLGLQPDVVLLHLGASDAADDRAVRPYVHFDASGIPVAAVNPLCDNRTMSPMARLTEEFALVDWIRARLGRAWEESAGESPDVTADPEDGAMSRLDSRRQALLLQQALEPLTEIRRLLAGIYCELIVTLVENPVADSPGRAERVGSTDTAGPPQSLAAILAERGIRCLDASEALNPDAGEKRPALSSAADHDRYAAAQAEFVVEHIPGVWTGGQTTNGLQPLPGVARSPRGETE